PTYLHTPASCHLVSFHYFFSLLRPPPPQPTLFPYTTLFRSIGAMTFQKSAAIGGLLMDALGADPPWERTAAELNRHGGGTVWTGDRKSTRLNSSHVKISYAVFCLKKKKKKKTKKC